MTPETLAEIDSAISFSFDLLRMVSAETRYELRQELAIKLFTRCVRIEGLRTAARNWLLNELRDLANTRKLEAEYAAGVGRRYRTDSDWCPTWYAPHVDAEEYAPFACDGARMMHVKGSSAHQDVHTATVDFVDSRRPRRS